MLIFGGETYSVLAKGMEPYLHTACANLAVIEALAGLCTTIDKARWGSDTSFRILSLSASCATLKPCHSGVCSIRVPAGRQCKYIGIEMGNPVWSDQELNNKTMTCSWPVRDCKY